MHHRLLRSARPLALCVLLACACDDAKPGAQPDAKPDAKSDAKSDAKPDAKSDADAKADDKPDTAGKRDRGSMTAQIGGVAWTGECNAKSPGDQPDKLKLSCSTMSTENGLTKRDSLQITIPGYTGVGEYTAASGTFTRVAIDAEAAKSALAPGEDGKEPSEAKQVGVLTKSIEDAGAFLLNGAKVSITAASDTEVEGTLAWTPGPEGGPTIEQAKFRAVIKAKK